jgi:hypothetical protein
MHLRIVTRRAIEGIEACVPSIRECETWAKTEEEALAGLLERIAFFLNLPANFKHKLDLSRREEGETFYTLVLP